MAKYCKDCKYLRREAAEIAPGRMTMVGVCGHPDMGHPVSGDPIPAEAARMNDYFCGKNAKGFIKAEESPKTPDEPPKGRILTAT